MMFWYRAYHQLMLEGSENKFREPDYIAKNLGRLKNNSDKRIKPFEIIQSESIEDRIAFG